MITTNLNNGDAMTPLQQAQLAQQNQQMQQKTQQSDLSAIQPYVQGAISDLNSGNYAGAWNEALETSPLYQTGYGQTTNDPLLLDMESAQGLQTLDPSLQWTPQSEAAYYNALGQNPVYNGKTVNSTVDGVTGAESLGKNPYGTWGSGAAVTGGSDASANASQEGDTPDVERFAGATPTKNFAEKYGADIGALALTAVTMGAAAPAMAAAMGGTLAADAAAGAIAGGISTLGSDAITGAPVTLGGVGAGILGGAATGGLTGMAGGAINSATGIGTTASDALAGAGLGAGTAALKGGNPLIGAVGGGLGGAIQGSGISGTATSALNSAGLPSPLSSAVVGGVQGALTGGVTGALRGNAGAGALSGAVSSGVGAGVNNAVSGIGGSIPGLGTAIMGAGIVGNAVANAPKTSRPTLAQQSASVTPTQSTTTSIQPANSGATPQPPPVTYPVAGAPGTGAAPPVQQQQQVQPTAPSGTAPQNIGAYSGYQQQQPQNINWDAYGQGPEAQFFTGEQ